MKKRKWYGALAAAVCLSLLWAVPSLADERSEKAQKLLAVMTQEDKAGQMLMVSPSQLCDGDWTEDIGQVIQNIELYHIGSLIFFEEDMKDQEAVKNLTKAIAAREFLFGVLPAADPSGSLEDGFAKPPEDANLAVGPFEEGAEDLWAYGAAGVSGEELRSMGIAVDLSPGIRTEETEDSESDPFFAIVTHAKVNADSEPNAGRPASMSRSMVANTLRNVFEGVIVTDSLSMSAATESFGADMAVQYAFQAGNDILTAPVSVMNAYYGLLSAMAEELVSGDQVDESVLRILEAKIALGII